MVERATSHTFFEELVFPLYYTLANTDLDSFEKRIDNILKRYSDLFGQETATYFSLAYLKTLVVEATQSEDPFARYLSLIRKMEALDLDPSLHRQQLLKYLVAAGNYQKALPVVNNALVQAKEKIKKENIDDESIDSIKHGVVCSLTLTLSFIKQKLKLNDRKLYLKYCFNEFEWPSQANIIYQSEAMSNLIISELVSSTSLLENKKVKVNLNTFVSKTLENNRSSNPLLAPFVLMKMMLIDSEPERKKIKDKYFNKETFENNSPFIDKSMWQIEYFHALANYLIDRDADDEFLLSTLDFINRSLEPSLSSPINSMVAERTSEQFQREGVFQLIQTDKKTKPVLKRLYKMHNLLKFGPNEQIVMRSKTLSRSQREKYNALLNQKIFLSSGYFIQRKILK